MDDPGVSLNTLNRDDDAVLAEADVRPSNVVEALACVMRDLPTIGRDGRAPEEHGGYAYRRIEQITAHASPLLARYGVVFVPEVRCIERRDVTLARTTFTDTVLTVRYRIFGPGGPRDHIEATVVGIGRASSDKGGSKALTQAFKYVLTQVLCVADAKDDADGQTWVADVSEHASRSAIDRLAARIHGLPPEVAGLFREWKSEQGFTWPWSQDAVDLMHDKLDVWLESLERLDL
jgi:hypothetical protein